MVKTDILRGKKYEEVYWAVGIFAAALAIFYFLHFNAVEKFKSSVNKISIASGRKFSVTFVSNKTTGYGWQVAGPFDRNVLELKTSAYIPSRANLAGADGNEVWTFKALRPGSCVIHFEYVRPWEKNTPPAESKDITIVIR